MGAGVAQRMHHEYRVEKADRFLQAAHLAYEHGHYETSVSRAYYAVFHLVAWVLLERRGVDRNRWDHVQLHKEFLDNFCKRGFLFSAADGDVVAKLLEARRHADYDDVRFERQEVERLVTRATSLCAKIEGAAS